MWSDVRPLSADATAPPSGDQGASARGRKRDGGERHCHPGEERQQPMGRSRGAARPLLVPLKNVRKSDEVFAQLEALIRAGRFPPGTRLASERELAAKFNASRQTIREALYRA